MQIRQNANPMLVTLVSHTITKCHALKALVSCARTEMLYSFPLFFVTSLSR